MTNLCKKTEVLLSALSSLGSKKDFKYRVKNFLVEESSVQENSFC